jgi:predicted  nucleic acid-binding Zn-ribbon protein
VIFPALFMVFLITGCNPDTKEKKGLISDMEYIRTEIEKEIVQSTRILSELNDYKNKLSNLEDKRSLKEIEKAKCRYDLGKYVLNHKPIYCLFHPGKWIKITWYIYKLSNTAGEISAIDNRIYELKRKIGLLKIKHNDYEESIDALKARLAEKVERYDSL